MAAGQQAQGFAVDVKLRQGACRGLVAAVEFGCAGTQAAGVVTQGMGVVDLLG